MAKPNEGQVLRAGALRERVKARMREQRLNPSRAARLVGLIPQTMNEFLKGRTPSDENMDLIEAWLDGDTGVTSDTIHSSGEPDEEFWIRYDAIEARKDLTNAEKERRIENLSSALRAMAYRWDARASDSRNRAMRAEAVGRGRRDVPPSDPSQVRTYKDLDPLPRSTKRVRRRGGEKE